MKKIIVSNLLLIICLLILNCGIENIDEAAQIANKVLELLKEKKYEETYVYYSKEFWSITTHEKWKKILSIVEDKLGKIEDFKQTSWHVNSKVGTGAGTYFDFKYDVKYTKAKAVVTFKLFKQLNSEEILIIGHHFNSEALIE